MLRRSLLGTCICCGSLVVGDPERASNDSDVGREVGGAFMIAVVEERDGFIYEYVRSVHPYDLLSVLKMT